MRCRWVVHVVGPVFSAAEDRSQLLASCYREAMAIADDLEAGSIAFPAVSAGVFGWPIDSAADIAVATIAGTSTQHLVDVRFVLFNQPVYDEFARALASL